MSGKFNAAASDYNKDAVFAQINIDETTKVTLSEAIAKDSHDNYITVYGFVELPLVGVEQMGKPNWVYEPCLCKFQVPKKDYSTEYQGKKKEYKQSPGMKATVHVISAYGFDKPFSGRFDFSMALPVAETVITGKNPDGTDASASSLTMIADYFIKLEPLEKLDKMEGKEIKEYSKGGGGYGGAKGQTEAEKLKDRLTFIKAQMMPDSDIGVILASLGRTDYELLQSEIMASLLGNLFN